MPKEERFGRDVLSSPFAVAFFLVCWTMSALSLFSFRRASRLPMTRLVCWSRREVLLVMMIWGLAGLWGIQTYRELSRLLGDTHDDG